jgi:antitoxin component YwqK of YwqJK toxin-antitoxin module
MNYSICLFITFVHKSTGKYSFVLILPRLTYYDMNQMSSLRFSAAARLLLLFIVLTLNSQNIIAQTSGFVAENKLDAQGKKDGAWRKLDSLGRIQYEGQFRHGVPYGEFRYFYDTGKTRTISQISDDGNTSKTNNFHPNGMKMAEGTYIKKLKEGEWNYYDENGILISKESYVAGKKSGNSYTFFSDGKLLEEKHFESDVQVGPWKQYFTDGGIKTNAEYVKGKIEGTATFYYPGGKVMARGNYLHNLKHGVWTFMSEEGKKQKEDTYEMGYLVNTTNYEPQPKEEPEK